MPRPPVRAVPPITAAETALNITMPCCEAGSRLWVRIRNPDEPTAREERETPNLDPVHRDAGLHGAELVAARRRYVPPEACPLQQNLEHRYEADRRSSPQFDVPKIWPNRPVEPTMVTSASFETMSTSPSMATL